MFWFNWVFYLETIAKPTKKISYNYNFFHMKFWLYSSKKTILSNPYALRVVLKFNFKSFFFLPQIQFYFLRCRIFFWWHFCSERNNYKKIAFFFKKKKKDIFFTLQLFFIKMCLKNSENAHLIHNTIFYCSLGLFLVKIRKIGIFTTFLDKL